MSDPVSALGGAVHDGFARIEEVGPLGMVTLRGDLSAPTLAAAVEAAVGLPVPAMRRVCLAGAFGAGWMSPDELLLLMPHAEVAERLAALQAALAGQHALAVDVSDARAVFRIRGPRAAEVLMKLCPVDFAMLAEGELRRTRAAQVAAALWRSAPEEFTLVCFRSVAGYVMGLLAASAAPGSELGLLPGG